MNLVDGEATSGSMAFGDTRQAIEYFFEQGWTDGLPVVPPTEEAILEFLEYVELEPHQIVAEYEPRVREVTAEKVAINAVMAGCKPEYMPIVLTAVKAVTTNEFALNHIATTSSAWPLLIINGPQVKQLDFNNGMYVFGPGTRANATVGRALSLILANCFDARIGGIQRGNMGHAGRFGFCIAENEDTPWEPLHLERGFARDANVVTAFPSGFSPSQFAVPRYRMSASQAADIMARTLTDVAPGLTYYLFVLSPPIQELFLREGWSKRDLQEYLFEQTSETVAWLKRRGRWRHFGSPDGLPPGIEPGDEERRVYLLKRDQHRDELWQSAELDREPEVLIVTAGGDAGNFGALVTSHSAGTRPVSLEVV